VTVSTPLFLRWELDADGHAYQLLALGEERLQLYPVLDPISLAHTLEVARTILPAVVELFEADPQRFAAFHAFFELFVRIRDGDVAALENLDDVHARVLDALRAAINDRTADDEVRRRAFAYFYQQAICDNDRYRAKASQSLERLIARLGELHAER